MQNLVIFITIVIPYTVLGLLIFAYFIQIVGYTYLRHVFRQIEELDDMMDSYYYEVEQFKKNQKKQCFDNVYADPRLAMEILVALQN